MKIKFNISGLRRTQWHEYMVRFAFGGAVTALAGLIAKRWGAEIGGLFLAFPAIFPASATLLEKHEKQKKLRTGKSRTLRARELAGVDAAGAAMGSLGLIAFAVIVWQGISRYPLPVVLSLGTLAWALVAGATWVIHQTLWRSLRTKRLGAARHSATLAVPQESSIHRKVR